MATYSFPYLDPHQARDRAPTDWEMALASAIEQAFGQGHHGLPALVAALNASRVRPRDGGTWTEDGFIALMRELAG